jgi:hypothetical protein
MTTERFQHIKTFLEEQRHYHSIGVPSSPATIDPASEPLLTDSGKHVLFSYELADALEKLMHEKHENNEKLEIKTSA